MTYENFSSEEYEKKVSADYYEIQDNSIKWNKVTRSTPGEVRKQFDAPIKDFEIQYDLTISNIEDYGEKNRHLITTLKLWKESSTILSTYIAERKNTNECRLVFFQRKNKQNVFVYNTINLELNIRYHITIKKKQNEFNIIVKRYDNNRVVDKSPNLIGDDDSYNDIILTQGLNFETDSNDSSSGLLENLCVTRFEIEKGVEEPPNKAFISFCYVSGNDFAEHLDKGLGKNKIPTFYSERHIDMGENWEDKIVENVKNSKFVIFIMTPGYYLSRVIRREISLALEWGKLITFKHKGLDDKHLCAELTDDYTKQGTDKPIIIDFRKEQIAEFNTKDDLFRKVYYELDKFGWFDHLSICERIKDLKEYEIYNK